MILVDIYVPSLDKTYDFQVDETIQTEKLIMEIAEMIGNDVKTEKKPETEKMLLCSMDQKRILQKNVSLQFSEIKNGSKLMLV